MSKQKLAQLIKSWNNGAPGFFKWLEDIQPMIPSHRGGFERFQMTDFQKRAIEDALALRDDGRFEFKTIIFSFPRRHSKTTVAALLVLWRFVSRATQNVKVMANSERQTMSVGFGLVSKIVLNTPILRELIGKENIKQYSLEFPALQSRIEAVNTNAAALYGEKIDIGWISEIHAAKSDEAMQILASSLGDSLDSWLLLDSTVDTVGGHLHRLEQLSDSGEDPTIFVMRIEYEDLQEALEKSPPWIDRDWLRSRSKQLVPAIFASQHLNQRSAASNNLFHPDHIKACCERLPNPVPESTIESLVNGRKYIIGGGLDRAYGFSMHGDSTIWTTVMKVGGVGGNDAEYIVLHQKKIGFSSGKGIKRAIADDHNRYDIENVVIESYNAGDIATWATEARIANEIVHPTQQHQAAAFTELHRIVSEGRLKFPAELETLQREMETFIYELDAGKPKFGGRKHHDDTVYSLAWAIYATRDIELATYELPGVYCDSRSSNAPHCFMRSGKLILLCSEGCESYKRVERMHLQHLRSNVNSEVTIPDFFETMVQVKGAKVYRNY